MTVSSATDEERPSSIKCLVASAIGLCLAIVGVGVVVFAPWDGPWYVRGGGVAIVLVGIDLFLYPSRRRASLSGAAIEQLLGRSRGDSKPTS